MAPTVAVFTDTYLPTVNGVTYTIRSWRRCWERRGGRMHVVYPRAAGYHPAEDEHPVWSVKFPFYEGFHVGLPAVPDAVKGSGSGSEAKTVGRTTDGRPTEVTDGAGPAVGSGDGVGTAASGGPGTGPDVVHAHTPFLLGLSGRRCARSLDVPLVASYHTPTAEYADYIADGVLSRVFERIARGNERRFMNSADTVIVPSRPARQHLRSVGIRTPIEIVPNGVDLERFRPVDTTAFRERHDLPDGPLVGYTGRHGYEKNLGEILDAADGLSAPVVFAGDGPHRAELEARADGIDADIRFLGFLDREELPAFYSILDVFAFPSPVETQGLVALEATACGTPVVGANAGALAETVVDGENGYTYDPGTPDDFRAKIERALDERETLSESCLDRRDGLSVDYAVDRLADVYDGLV